MSLLRTFLPFSAFNPIAYVSMCVAWLSPFVAPRVEVRVELFLAAFRYSRSCRKDEPIGSFNSVLTNEPPKLFGYDSSSYLYDAKQTTNTAGA